MSLLKKDDLWNAIADLPAEDVELHDSNGKLIGSIRMRGLTGSELTAYQESMTIRMRNGETKPNTRYAMSKLIVLSAINEDGSPYFDKGEVMKLDSAPVRMLMPLFESVQRLSGLSDEAFQEMTAGFEETENEDSSSV